MFSNFSGRMITKRKNIHSGHSLWEHLRAPGVPQRRLARDIDTEILIVGAGITGAMIADVLCEAGFETTVVERRRVTHGATAASTALVQYEIDTPLRELARKIGHRDAVRAWRRSRLAVAALKAHLDEAEIPSVRRSTLYLAGNKLNRAGLIREAEARNAAGLETVVLDRAALKQRFGIARSAALLGFDNLTVNPRYMAAAFLKRACKSGLRIFAPVDIVDIEATRTRVIATTRDGRRIRCRRLVLATGYELPKIIPAKGHKIGSTWALATPPQRRRLWPEECLIWEASDPYLYMRTTDDGRVICGGEDEEFATRRTAGRTYFPQDRGAAAQAWQAVSPTGRDRRIRVGVVIRRKQHGNSDHRRNSGLPELLGHARLWRQWHHLQPHRRGNPAHVLPRRAGRGCGSFCLLALAANLGGPAPATTAGP